MSKEFATKLAAVGLALSLGSSACGSSLHEATPKPARQSDCNGVTGLTAVRLIGGAKDGGINAVNVGECAIVYNPANLKDVGAIATQGAIDIECVEGPKPAAFRVVTGTFEGDVNMSMALAHQIPTTFKDVPNCIATDVQS